MSKIPYPVDSVTADFNDPQMEIFLKAFEIYEERQKRFGDDVWKASGWRGMLVDMRKKMERLFSESWDKAPDDLDSAYDLINFTAFFIRQVEVANRDGHWKWGQG